MGTCKDIFHAIVNGCVDNIVINAGFEPGKLLVWQVHDVHHNFYTQQFTADENGAGILNKEGLPDGLINPVSSGIFLRVYDKAGVGVIMNIQGKEYGVLGIRFEGGNGINNIIR